MVRPLLPVVVLIWVSLAAFSQNRQGDTLSGLRLGPAIIHENVDIADRDTFYGPGGREALPDLSRITFIEKETSGYNKKYRIRDGSGRIWVAKYGREAKPETAAVRILWALGYPTETNYWVPELNIPGVKKLKNVRLEARPDDIKRGDTWDWNRNPFVGTNEIAGLKIMMVLFNNWDIATRQNKIIEDKRTGREYYIISDLGATFGKLPNNGLPIFWRLGRSIGKPNAYARGSLVRNNRDGRLELSFKGKNYSIFKGVTIAQGRWLADRLLQLSDGQIRDAFRAASYWPAEIEILTRAVKTRIRELDVATSRERIAADTLPGKPRRPRHARSRRH
jgi:hypothetical protein